MGAALRHSALLGAAAVLAVGAASQPVLAGPTTDQQRLDELKAMKRDMVRMMHQYEARISALEAEMKEEKQQVAKVQAAKTQTIVVQAAPAQKVIIDPHEDEERQASASQPQPEGLSGALKSWGAYDAGNGFVLVRGRLGEIDARLIAYARYLNQTQLDPSYTDSFGRTFKLHLRQDVQWNKVNLSFKGWLFDPNFTYRVWVWTQQPAMGEGAQVVVGGQLGYRFFDWLSVYAGIAPLPSTRSTNWTYPFWLKMDNRTVADEFFRASYSQGFWADGSITDDLQYRFMISNNLSALGVSAAELDSQFNTMSAALWWMPTTGEFGPALGFGDFEGHEQLATLFGIHFTRSREDKQDQPGVDAFENSQIRLSDGTLVFSPNAFNTGGQVDRATYQMLDANAGFKYLGWSLEAEYYARWISDFKTTGFIPVKSLFDQGYQVQASAMIIPKQLQAYVSGSEILGQYGDPWDATLGLNWYPFWRREFHINTEAIYLHHSPVGGSSYPYIVGGNGWLFNTDFILTF
ncbi:MAG TPA: hypothetical protein VLV55_01630 [Rhizomicrobium sp.]|nr:hypothetical protein [Rhizomicrobium sp.]